MNKNLNIANLLMSSAVILGINPANEQDLNNSNYIVTCSTLINEKVNKQQGCNLTNNPDIFSHDNNYQTSYNCFVGRGNGYIEDEPENIQIAKTQADLLKECEDYFSNLQTSLTQWLANQTDNKWQEIRETISQLSQEDSELKILIQTSCKQLWRLPWAVFDLCKNNNVEIGISPTDWKEAKTDILSSRSGKIRILVVVGDSTNITAEDDLTTIQNLLKDTAEIMYIKPQSASELIAAIEDETGYDLFFFAGHSYTTANEGIIKLSQNLEINIAELRTAFTKAIKKGLKIAFFNSCDGIGLASNLSDMGLPISIIMKDSVPDEVAKQFLADFLKYYATEGKPLYISVRQARENLDKFKDKYPGITYLPMIFQHPYTIPPTWQTLREINWQTVTEEVLKSQKQRQLFRRQFTTQGAELKIFVPLGLVERKKEQQKRTGEIESEQVYQLKQEVIVKEYQYQEFFDEVILDKNNKYVVVVGEPGAGKTTILETTATKIGESLQGLPICIRLANLQGRSLQEYILTVWLEEALQFIPQEKRANREAIIESLQECCRTGKVWLMLDGLDEMSVSAIEALNSITQQLEGFLDSVRVLLTVRLNVWDERENNPLSQFKTYKTQEFSELQVKEFITGWFGQLNKLDLSQTLITELQEGQYQTIRKMVKNPLILSLLCQTWEENKGKLPQTRAGLYKRFVQYYNNNWNENHKVLNRLQELELNQALGKLALRGIKSETRFRLRENDILNEIGSELFQLAIKLGWLNIVDRDVDSQGNIQACYAFFHPSFQEYFAATVIDDWHFLLNHISNNPQQGTYRIFEPKWLEAILYWLGRNDVDKRKKQEFIKALTDFEDRSGVEFDFYRFRAYLLAATGAE